MFKKKKYQIVLLITIFNSFVYGQVQMSPKPIQKPQPSLEKKLTKFDATIKVDNSIPVHANSLKMGATAEDVQRQLCEKLNRPYYPPNSTPEERQKININFIRSQNPNDPLYKSSSKNNGFEKPNISDWEKEINSILQDIINTSREVESHNYYESERYNNDLENYQNAQLELNAMLNGSSNLSLKDAVYIIESAYGKPHITYEQYDALISASALFIENWLKQNKYSLDNQEALNYGIQRFLSDTLELKQSKSVEDVGGIVNYYRHFPFIYDFEDPRARKDKSNYFVTKTLATGSGQCHSLPLLYLVLAEAMGAKAYLSYAPQHSFIKFVNNDGVIQNYETTIDWFMTDQNYANQLPVMAEAIRNGLYLDTINTKGVVATLLIDLAISYKEKHWLSDGEFINQCIDTSAKYFKGNAEVYYLKSLLLANQVDEVSQIKNIDNLQDLLKIPEGKRAYMEYKKNEENITKLGLQDFPESVYIEMLEMHDAKGKLQKSKGIDTKSIKDLFSN